MTTIGQGISFGTGITIEGQYLPAAPQNIVSTAIDYQSASVAFTVPNSDGNSPIISYTAISTPGNLTGTVTQSGSGSITVTGLTKNTNYTFVVYATTAIGRSVNSSPSNQITTFGVPDAPTIGTATDTAWSTVTVTYTAPLNNGGSTITSYTAVSSPEGKTGTVSQSGSGSITVVGLNAAVNYTFTVYATNIHGDSASSSASNSVPGGNGVSPAPAIVSVYPTSQTTIGIDYTAPVGISSGNSVYFDGSSTSYINPTSSSTNYAIGTTAFTIECWFYTISKTNAQPVLVSNGTFTTNKWLIYDRHNSYPGAISVSLYNGSASPGWLVGATPIENNKWYHVALVRESTGWWRLYVNGVLDGVNAYSLTADGGTTQSIYIGKDGTNSYTAHNGYISNVRLVKGIAVYTGPFTVPEVSLPATQSTGTNISAIPGTTGKVTVLLTCQSSTIVDNSTYHAAMTTSGTAAVSTKTPLVTVGSTFTAVSSPGNFSTTVTGRGTGTLTISGLSTNIEYTFTMYATVSGANTLSSLPSGSVTINTTTPSQSAYTTAGTYSWVVPSNVYSISTVCVGSGSTAGAGQPSLYGLSGLGGDLSYRNNLAVTPGSTITVAVGASPATTTGSSSVVGNPSYIQYKGARVVSASGGGTSLVVNTNPNQITFFGGSSGGAGSFGGNTNTDGGGGAAGYSGDGGRGGQLLTVFATPTGGGGGGGGSSYVNSTYNLSAAGGGGVGILGQGADGVSGAVGAGGIGGSGGTNGGNGGTTSTGGAGGNYGGGGGAGAGGRGTTIAGGRGGVGAVRIIWPGDTRYFPSTQTGDV